MNVMLAEDIGGWLLAATIFFGAIVATILAIVAAFPAKRGSRFAATILATPGIIVGISSILLFGHTVIVGDHEYFWLLTAFPPLTVSGLVTFAAWSSGKKP